MSAPPPPPLHLQVPTAAAGSRLDHFLVRLAGAQAAPAALQGHSRSQLQRWLQGGAVQIDGSPAAAARRLRGGECLRLQAPTPQPSPLLPIPMELEILYEDDDVLALNKAAGVVVHAGAGTTGPTLVQGLLAHCADLRGIGDTLRPGIVHRLDRHTSGVLIVAKHDRALQGLAAQFARRQVDKEYLAVVYGRPRAAAARLEGPFGRDRRRRQCFTSLPPRLAARPPPRRAVTDYEVLHSGLGLSLLRLRLHTGRTHQIRVHLADLGHPVVGDALYGAGRQLAPPLAAAALRGQALHAHCLQLCHPLRQTPLRLRAELPAGLARLIELLGGGDPQLFTTAAGGLTLPTTTEMPPCSI